MTIHSNVWDYEHLKPNHEEAQPRSTTMTRQTVSICNCHDGVALDGFESSLLALALESSLQESPPCDPETRDKLNRVIRVLRGETLTECTE